MAPRTALEGSYVTPSFEHARVSDAMRAGVMTCPPDTTVEQVARMMATNHIHCVVVLGDGVYQVGAADRPWGLISDIDLVRAASGSDAPSAGEICATELLTVEADDTLVRAAQLMVDHETSHLLVVDPASRTPVGVLSTIDLAGVIGWGRA